MPRLDDLSSTHGRLRDQTAAQAPDPSPARLPLLRRTPALPHTPHPTTPSLTTLCPAAPRQPSRRARRHAHLHGPNTPPRRARPLAPPADGAHARAGGGPP